MHSVGVEDERRVGDVVFPATESRGASQKDSSIDPRKDYQVSFRETLRDRAPAHAQRERPFNDSGVITRVRYAYTFYERTVKFPKTAFSASPTADCFPHVLTHLHSTLVVTARRTATPTKSLLVLNKQRCQVQGKKGKVVYLQLVNW